MGAWGDNIRKWRVEVAELSQVELGERIGAYHGSVSQWENGVVRVPPDKGKLLLDMAEGHLGLEDMGYTTNESGDVGYYIFRRVEWGKMTRAKASLDNLSRTNRRRLGGPSYVHSREGQGGPSRESNLDETGTPVEYPNQEDEGDEPTETNVTHRKL